MMALKSLVLSKTLLSIVVFSNNILLLSIFSDKSVASLKGLQYKRRRLGEMGIGEEEAAIPYKLWTFYEHVKKDSPNSTGFISSAFTLLACLGKILQTRKCSCTTLALDAMTGQYIFCGATTLSAYNWSHNRRFLILNQNKGPTNFHLILLNQIPLNAIGCYQMQRYVNL